MEALGSETGRGLERRRKLKILTRGGSWGANRRISLGTMDSAAGKLALLAVELNFSHSHKPLG